MGARIVQTLWRARHDARRYRRPEESSCSGPFGLKTSEAGFAAPRRGGRDHRPDGGSAACGIPAFDHQQDRRRRNQARLTAQSLAASWLEQERTDAEQSSSAAPTLSQPIGTGPNITWPSGKPGSKWSGHSNTTSTWPAVGALTWQYRRLGERNGVATTTDRRPPCLLHRGEGRLGSCKRAREPAQPWTERRQRSRVLVHGVASGLASERERNTTVRNPVSLPIDCGYPRNLPAPIDWSDIMSSGISIASLLDALTKTVSCSSRRSYRSSCSLSLSR